MEVDRVWSFTVDVDNSSLGQVQLLSPGDTTGVAFSPPLCFQTLVSTGNITYDIQLDTSFLFGSPIWETQVTVSGSTGGELCVSIGIPLTNRVEYYWRVFAFTASTTGNFSDLRSFYLGDSVSASPDSVLVYDPSPFFRLTGFVPDNGTTNQSSHPTIIATFSQPISGMSINTNTVQVFVAPVDGRTAIPTFQDLNATYTVVDNQILISPSTLIQPNQRYTIVLNPPIESIFGTFFNETFNSYYTSFYKPIYGALIGVRSRLGGFINTVSDDEILFFLWRASLHVNELLATRVFRVRDRISYDELINYDPPFKTWGQEQYAELYATAHLIESFYYDLLQEGGRRTALSVFETELQVSILSEIRERLKEVRKE
ncbi:MAG TPA: Ig-like domain-containing protein, partial [Methylomirabilota bacterium]|nr:Ig-like domain-containing protein [Methylomirabilota bacterium]